MYIAAFAFTVFQLFASVGVYAQWMSDLSDEQILTMLAGLEWKDLSGLQPGLPADSADALESAIESNWTYSPVVMITQDEYENRPESKEQLYLGICKKKRTTKGYDNRINTTYYESIVALFLKTPNGVNDERVVFGIYVPHYFSVSGRKPRSYAYLYGCYIRYIQNCVAHINEMGILPEKKKGWKSAADFYTGGEEMMRGKTILINKDFLHNEFDRERIRKQTQLNCGMDDVDVRLATSNEIKQAIERRDSNTLFFSDYIETSGFPSKPAGYGTLFASSTCQPVAHLCTYPPKAAVKNRTIMLGLSALAVLVTIMLAVN